jgi:hypothetical protein
MGPALVDAKYAAIGYLDKDKETAASGAMELRETLRNLAATSDLRRLGDYAPIHEAKLVAALDSMQNAKRLLGPKDRLMLAAPGHKIYKVDLTKTWDPSETIPINTATTEEKHSEGEVILTIRKPDMVGQSKWQFARGKFPVFARVSDEEWLLRFHARKMSLHSGDAMRCKVKFTYIFDDRGTMIEEQIEVVKVLEIISGAGGEQLSIGL